DLRPADRSQRHQHRGYHGNPVRRAREPHGLGHDQRLGVDRQPAGARAERGRQLLGHVRRADHDSWRQQHHRLPGADPLRGGREQLGDPHLYDGLHDGLDARQHRHARDPGRSRHMEYRQRGRQRDRSMREEGRMLLRRLLSAALVALFVSSVSHAEAPSGTGPLLAGQTATRLPGNRWLLVGGQSGTSSTAGVTIYDVGTGAQTALPPLRTARAGHTATILPDGTVLVVGGVGTSGAVVAAPELIDAVAGTTEVLDDAGLVARTDHTATLLTDGRVLIAGGRGNGADTLAAAQ